MAVEASAAGSTSLLNCGLVRDRGTARTSTSTLTSAAVNRSASSTTGRVEWPTVKNGSTRLRSFDDRRIGEGSQLATQRVGGRQTHLHDLGHEHHDHLLARIDPERR